MQKSEMLLVIFLPNKFLFFIFNNNRNFQKPLFSGILHGVLTSS